MIRICEAMENDILNGENPGKSNKYDYSDNM